MFFIRLIMCLVLFQCVISIQIKERKIEDKKIEDNETLYNYVEVENITEKELDKLTIKEFFSFITSNTYNFFIYIMKIFLYVEEVIELFVSMYTFKLICTLTILLFSMYKLYYNVKIKISK